MQFFHDNKVEPNIDLEELCKEKNWFLIPYPENKKETLKSISKDGFTVKDGEIVKTSNHAGGIMGGISDGSEIILRVHIKPTPSISQPQQTVTKDKEPLSMEIHGRHDPVIVPRAVVVVESMAAITLADALFANMSSQMDKVRDFYL